jgi:hypothetical protein
MNAGDVDHRILPGLPKMQKAGQVKSRMPIPTLTPSNAPSTGIGISTNVKSGSKANASSFYTPDQVSQIQTENAIQEARDRQGYITQAEPAPSAMSKAWNVLTHPMTALQYKMPYWSSGRRAPDLPDHFERGPRNSLEIASDIINPFFYLNEAKEFGKGAADIAYKGVTDPLSLSGMDFLNTGMHFLGAAPVIAEAIQGVNFLKPGFQGFNKAYNATSGITNQGARLRNALNAGSLKLGYLSGDINGHSYFNMHPDEVRRLMSIELSNLPKGAYTVDGSMSKNSAPLFWSQAARNKPGFTLVNTGETQGLNWSGNMGKRLRGALPENIENIFPQGAELKEALQNRIDYLRKLNDPKSLAKAAQLERDGITSQIITDLPDVAQGDPRLKNALSEFLENYKPTLDKPIIDVNKNTGLDFPMTKIGKENIGNSSYNLYTQPTGYLVKGDPLFDRASKVTGDYIKKRTNSFYFGNEFQNPRLPFIQANSMYNLGKDLYNNTQYKMGGQPCYECGGMYTGSSQPFYKYQRGGTSVEERSLKGKDCGIQRGINKENARMNAEAARDAVGWAKQAARNEKIIAAQDAAQAAGQLNFDYDWSGYPVEKAEKKAAMAQYKQFLQQNPNVFVGDDTSGYNPEQKYIIANKLKQKISTPVFGKNFQQQFGVDPKLYDLQRIQSEMAPKMGGWGGMRNWLFNIYKQQGGPVLDPRGQWAHPGKVTRIPGSDITMQGVPYPVLGVGSNGQQQMMQPGKDYNFGGASYVDEYPMMQFGGGTLLGPSTMLLSLASKAANYFSKPNSSETKNLASTPYKQMNNTFYNKNEEFYNKRNANDKMNYDSSVNPINLTSGRFRGAKVAPGMINDIVNAAKTNNVDPWLMLSLVGRESTFGTDKEYINHREANNKQDLISGWNVAEDYQPYEVNRYLADKKVPGIKVIKDSSGWNYEVEDQQAIESYLKSNPKLIEDYYKKLASTPDLGKLDSFSLAAQRIKKKGVKNYNPGDPRYPSMVNQDMNLLKNDAALKAYMKTLGYRQGGEFGGGLLSQTVSCSNCGHSWKAADGGYDPMTCHKCGGVVKMKGGGYVVTRSNDRKGKTHKVTGPDGTVKYFGDSKLGQHPKDPERKAAFYARHKKNLDGNPYFRAFARKTWEDGGTIPQYQFAGPVSKTDSVRHQAGKIVKYEDLQGGPGGAPLPIYRDPKYISMLMNDVYPEIQKILPNASAMEASEAMDFVFNSGWDRDNKKMTKDPRAYAIQEYYRKYDPNKLTDTSWPDGPTWLGRKNAPYSFDQEYNSTIGKLSENERRVLMNKGRDWYYRHTAPKGSTWDLKTQGPHPDYNATWYGRIWNTNDFLPFNPNNPNFKPKKEDGGELSLWDMIKMAQGGEMIRRADGSYSKRGLWDNIRANKGSGKKPTKQMLEQERKIKAKNK